MVEYEGRIDLVSYLRVIGRRKWLILSATLLCALLGGIYSFLQPTQWNVDAIIQGGTFFSVERHEEVVIATGEELAGRINEGYYNGPIASALNIAAKDVPKLKAKNLRWTERAEVSIKTADVDMAKRVLNALFAALKKDLDKRIDTERQNQTAQVQRYESIIREETQEIQSREKEIAALQEKKRAAQDSLRRSGGQDPQARLQITEIEAAIRQINTELGILKIFRETSRKDSQQLITTFGQNEPTQFIKEPTPSAGPVSPQKTLNILISALLGFLIFTLFAFFLEYLEQVSDKNAGVKP